MKKMGKEKAILFCIMFFLFVLLLLSRWDFPVLEIGIIFTLIILVCYHYYLTKPKKPKAEEKE
ncbi:MAG: hypothetical protein ACYS18_04795 [Planctomycetota bacterium]|jgi:L-asparagine transporter-like permease